MSSYWLMKTEPTVYGLSDLARTGKTNWSGVRNYQARNYLRTCKPGDHVLIYHSGKEKSVVGIAEIISNPYVEIEGEEEWVQVDLKYVSTLKKPFSLSQIKKEPLLKALPILKQSQLSVMPITNAHYKTIIRLSK